jgi:hypothetical protein
MDNELGITRKKSERVFAGCFWRNDALSMLFDVR